MDFSLLLPEILVALLAVGVLIIDLVLPARVRPSLGYIAAVGMLAVIGIYAATGLRTGVEFGGGILRIDAFTVFFRILFLALGAIASLLSIDFVRKRLTHPGEFYALLLVATMAMMFMSASGEMLTAYLSLELLSFCLYVLAAFTRNEARTNESATKYVLLGALSSAFLLYGISYIYGVLGTTTFVEIAAVIRGGVDGGMALTLGTVLIVAGLGFKVSAVPFHMWAPDVYEGAPLPATAFLSAVSKAAGFALFLRLFSEAFGPSIESWQLVLAIVAAVTMTLGNLVALTQRNIKRLMAYSSIGQAGYLLMGIVAGTELAAGGMTFHIVGYALATLAAFLGITIYFNLTGKEQIEDYAGLAHRSPFLAMALMAAFFSSAGLPFFVGFATKFYLFAAVAQQGFLWLVGLAILNSIVSLYYYLQVVRQMYVEKGENASPLRLPAMSTALLAGLTVSLVVLGLYPAWVVKGAELAVTALF